MQCKFHLWSVQLMSVFVSGILRHSGIRGELRSRRRRDANTKRSSAKTEQIQSGSVLMRVRFGYKTWACRFLSVLGHHQHLLKSAAPCLQRYSPHSVKKSHDSRFIPELASAKGQLKPVASDTALPVHSLLWSFQGWWHSLPVRLLALVQWKFQLVTPQDGSSIPFELLP